MDITVLFYQYRKEKKLIYKKTSTPRQYTCLFISCLSCYT